MRVSFELPKDVRKPPSSSKLLMSALKLALRFDLIARAETPGEEYQHKMIVPGEEWFEKAPVDIKWSFSRAALKSVKELVKRGEKTELVKCLAEGAESEVEFILDEANFWHEWAGFKSYYDKTPFVVNEKVWERLASDWKESQPEWVTPEMMNTVSEIALLLKYVKGKIPESRLKWKPKHPLPEVTTPDAIQGLVQILERKEEKEEKKKKKMEEKQKKKGKATTEDSTEGASSLLLRDFTSDTEDASDDDDDADRNRSWFSYLWWWSSRDQSPDNFWVKKTDRTLRQNIIHRTAKVLDKNWGQQILPWLQASITDNPQVFRPVAPYKTDNALKLNLIALFADFWATAIANDRAREDSAKFIADTAGYMIRSLLGSCGLSSFLDGLDKVAVAYNELEPVQHFIENIHKQSLYSDLASHIVRSGSTNFQDDVQAALSTAVGLPFQRENLNWKDRFYSIRTVRNYPRVDVAPEAFIPTYTLPDHLNVTHFSDIEEYKKLSNLVTQLATASRRESKEIHKAVAMWRKIFQRANFDLAPVVAATEGDDEEVKDFLKRNLVQTYINQ